MGLRIVLPLIALCGGAGGRAHSADSPHLKYMSYYGLNPPAMKGWVNLGLEQWRDPNCEVGIDACNMSGVLDAWRDYKIPSFFGNVPASGSDAILQRGIGVHHGALIPEYVECRLIRVLNIWTGTAVFPCHLQSLFAKAHKSLVHISNIYDLNHLFS